METERGHQHLPRQDDYDDDEPSTLPPTTTLGPSPINIVDGIYGILTGLGSLNPDRVFQSTINFFPPSQQQTAQALINSALGKDPGTWPTTPSTLPTTTKLTTSTKDPADDEYDNEDNEETTKKTGGVPPTSAANVAVATTPPQTTVPAVPPVPTTVQVG